MDSKRRFSASDRDCILTSQPEIKSLLTSEYDILTEVQYQLRILSYDIKCFEIPDMLPVCGADCDPDPFLMFH